MQRNLFVCIGFRMDAHMHVRKYMCERSHL